MIEIFLLVLTIIVIFSISILIYKIIKNKEGFINLDDTKDIKEARLKLNLENNLINYQKGSKGFDGEKGKQGPPPLPPDDGVIGEMGDDGINGKNYGSLIFKNNEDKVIDSLLNQNTKDPKHQDFNIQVPDAVQGATGVVGTILFVNHKKEIIGSYYPPDGPDGAYAKSLQPIIIDVPQGIIGYVGDNGKDGKHPIGPQGEKGIIGNKGADGERGQPGLNADKGAIGGGGDEDIFNNVKVGNKVCFKEDNNACIDIDILKTLVNYDDYLRKLENRRLRIIRKLCYLEFYDDYNNEKHANRDELIIEYKRQLKEIYDFNEESFNYSEIVNKETGTCPEFPEKDECTFNEDHLNDENQFLFNKCRCEKLTTNCGNGMFISRKAYKGKDDKERDVYVNDNKCSECTLKREHVDKEKNEIYIGCDGVYDGIAASCETNQYIQVIGGSKGYECKDVPTGYYIKPSRTDIEICPVGHRCVEGNLIECTGNQYQNKTGQSTCLNCITNCGDGRYRKNSCTSTTNHSCHDCKDNHYCTDGLNAKECGPSSCPSNQWLSATCSSTTNNKCSPCESGYICDGSANRKECTVCNSNQYQVSGCSISADVVCATFGPWVTGKGKKVGGGAPGRKNTWAVVRAGGGYDYSLIYWNDELICASFQVDGIITAKQSHNGVLQFRKGDLYDGWDDLKLNWAYDNAHSSFHTYNNFMNFGRFTHWSDAKSYHLEYRFTSF
tara:strand:- start:1072 stop:3240 length:2169 start_codon:yes stop_codon:yes gene_type:complete